MSDYSDDDEMFLMEQEDPRKRVTVEGIMEYLVRSLVSEDYGEPEYWETRYREDPEEYEWFLPWSKIALLVDKYVTGKSRALNLGCGNSCMSLQMLDCVERVTSIDISRTVVEQMMEKYRDENRLEWEVMDCTELRYESEFDIVVDKGTLDALYCSSIATQAVTETLEQACKALKSSGVFIDISFGDPSCRSLLIECTCMEFVEVIKIPNERADSRLNYIYVLRKPKHE